MPLLSDAKKLFVGGTSINKVFANGFAVWPKACQAMDGRPNTLPPGNDAGNYYPRAAYDNTYSGKLIVNYERIVDIRGLYDHYQIDVFDTEICEWRTEAIEPDSSISPGISGYSFDKAAINDFQSYDVRVIPIFTATGLPDQSVVLYATDTPATVPDRSPTAPPQVNVDTPRKGDPGSARVTWGFSIAPKGYRVEKYRVEIKTGSSDTWELFREEPTTSFTIREADEDGLVVGTTYQFRVAGIVDSCFSQSDFTESDPFVFL